MKSERRLEEEGTYNLAYKWFRGWGITEKARDATTLGANRRRRFRDNNIAEQIFDEILRRAIGKKPLIGTTTRHHRPRRGRFSSAGRTRTAGGCTKTASRTDSATASTGRWTAATT